MDAQNLLGKELEELRGHLSQTVLNIRNEQKRLEEARAKVDRQTQAAEGKKVERAAALAQLNEDIGKKKSEIEELNAKERTRNEQISTQKAATEATKDELSRLQDESERNQSRQSELQQQTDGLMNEVALAIDDLRNGGKKQPGKTRTEPEFRTANSEIYGRVDTIKKRELIRSRAPGRNKEMYDPTIATDYHCKCHIF